MKDLIKRLKMVKEFIKKVKAKDSYVRGYADARSMMMETIDETIGSLSAHLCQWCQEAEGYPVEFMGDGALYCGSCQSEDKKPEQRSFTDRRQLISEDIDGGHRRANRRKKDE